MQRSFQADVPSRDVGTIPNYQSHEDKDVENQGIHSTASMHGAPETQRTHSSTTNRASISAKVFKYTFASIEVNILIELQLLILTLSTGIQDAISFPDFGCFASNQTGNTVLLAVGLAGVDSNLVHLPSIGLSLALFLAGAALTGHVGHAIGSRRRAWLLLTNLIQTAMVFGAAAIQFAHGVTETGGWALGAIGLLAFSSGAQVASCRAMQVPEITTAMATAAWVDFIIDPKILVVSNRSRNRRALFLVFLVAGSFAGAFMQLRIGSGMALVVSAIGKSLAMGLLFVIKEEPLLP